MLKITMRNWMSHRHTEIDASDGVVMVVGPNAIGKTAIRDALEFAYLGTGKLRGIETKKDLATYSIQEGERECWVQVEIPGLAIRRTMNSAGTQKLKRTTDAGDETIALSDQATLLDGIAEDVLRIILEPTEWLSVPAARRAELLILATSTKVDDPAVIAKAMTDVLQPESPAETAAIARIAKIAAKDGMRAGEEAAVAARVEAKRKRDDLPTAEPSSDFEGIDLEGHTLDQHTQQLGKLRQQREQALVDYAARVGDAKARADEAYKALQKLLAWEPEPFDGKAEIDAQTARNGVQTARARVDELTQEWQAAVAHLRAETARAEGAPAKIEHPGQCPHLSVMKCPVKLEKFVDAQAKGAPDLPTAGELHEMEVAAEGLKTDIDVHSRSIETWQADLDAAQARVARNAAIKIEIQNHAAAVEAAETRVSELDAAAKALQAEADLAPAAGVDLAAIEARIAKGERIIVAKRTYDEAKAAHAANRARSESLQREIDCWDLIAKAMKPGAPVELALAGDAEAPFSTALQGFAAMSGEIAIQSDMTILVGPERRHPSQLSTSQRLALGIAIQHGFARLVGFPILICDAIDLFDGGRRATWAKCAAQQIDHYAGGILGLGTILSGRPKPPPAGFATIYLSTDGPTGAVIAERIESEREGN